MADRTLMGLVSVLFGLFFWMNAPGYADFQMKGKPENVSDHRAHLRWARIVAAVFVFGGALLILGAIGR